jgi:hypothetical protein
MMWADAAAGADVATAAPRAAAAAALAGIDHLMGSSKPAECPAKQAQTYAGC